LKKPTFQSSTIPLFQSQRKGLSAQGMIRDELWKFADFEIED
jgi:hypothetical protein